MDAKLIVVEGPDRGLEFTFDTGEEWIIGRDPNACALALKDEKIAEQHAKIHKDGARYHISPMGDASVKINDKDIQENTPLTFEDRITIGDTHLRFSETKETGEARASEYDGFFDDGDEFSDDLVPGLSSEGTASKEGSPEEKPPEEEKPEEKEPEPPSQNDEIKKEEGHYDTIFEDLGDGDTFHDLSDPYGGSERFILKVLAGPNTGAEFALQMGKSYILGTDVTGADIIFNDLSVSRHHARLSVTDQPEVLVEDLNSRNGVIVDGQAVQGQRALAPNNRVTLGTTTFVVLDREREEETLVPEQPTIAAAGAKKEESAEPAEKAKEEKPQKPKKRAIRESTFIVSGILFAVVLVFGVGAVTLFKTSPVERPKLDFTKEIQNALGNQYPDVKYTYNANGGSLFLVGHVLTTVDKEELLYTLNNLDFITGIDDNVVVDDAVSGEMNLVLSRYPIWRSINIHAPQPGRFVMSGYLPTREEGAELEDFVNVQFPYVDRLTNYVVIEEDLNQDILSKLHNYGFYSVQVELANGEVSLTGYVNSAYDKAFDKTIREISRIVGVRNVNNYVVVVGNSGNCGGPTAKLPYKSEGSPGSIGQTGEPAKSAEAIEEQFGSWLQDSCVVNLTDCSNESMDITHMYTIEGYADQGAIGRAVVIKGRILTVGDYLNGMRVLAIFENFVFLEKNGLKYKIEFNR